MIKRRQLKNKRTMYTCHYYNQFTDIAFLSFNQPFAPGMNYPTKQREQTMYQLFLSIKRTEIKNKHHNSFMLAQEGGGGQT